jgi:hypothetical protein
MVRQIADRVMPTNDYRVLINGPNCDLNVGGGVEYFIEGSCFLSNRDKRKICSQARKLPGVVAVWITQERNAWPVTSGNVRIRFATRANGQPAEFNNFRRFKLGHDYADRLTSKLNSATV